MLQNFPLTNFFHFLSVNRKICGENLESTRLTNPLPNNPPRDITPVPERHHERTPLRKAVKTRKIPRTPALAICDPDTSSDSQSDDESWKGSESSSSSSNSNEVQGGKKQTKKRPVTARKRVIQPPSYSDSEEDVSSYTDNPAKAKSPLSNVLDSCEYKPKSKLPATPATTGATTKRKLFNPNKTFEDVDVGDEVVSNARDMDHQISMIQDDVLSFRFDLPLVPKAVERIREKECGKTPAKTPSKKIDTPASKTKKHELFTPKDVVPVKKCGFLQSLDGKFVQSKKI